MTLVAVVGGGQLGRMLALAGYPLGLRFRFLDPDRDAPAGQIAEQVVGPYDDPAALARLVEGAAVTTYEFENVPHGATRWLEERARMHAGGFDGVFPSSRSLAIAQDRIAEKTFFRECGIPVAPFAAIGEGDELDRAAAEVGFPAVLKTRRLGYDGKGQCAVRERSGLAAAWERLGRVPCSLEQFVPFEREVSVLACRGRDGHIVTYSLVENVHVDGILRTSRVPAGGGAALADHAAAHVRRVLEALDHVGMLCIEFFVRDGALLANEMAPRVHNSGHWTIEGAVTSQFENHLRAVLGLPLSDPSARGAAAMVNLIGATPALDAMLAVRGASVHLYGKSPRAGRKVGHVTVVGATADALEARLSELRRMAGEDEALDLAPSGRRPERQ